MGKVYLVLAVVGFIAPYAIFFMWLAEYGFDFALFVQEIFGSKLALFAWVDVVISALGLVAFILYEGRARGMGRLWIPIVGTLCVGVSFGLPLFLYMRECKKSTDKFS